MFKLLSKISLLLILSCFAYSVESAIVFDDIPISTKEYNLLFNQFMNNYRSYLIFKDDTLDQNEINEIKRAVIDELLEENITKKYAYLNNISVNQVEIQDRVDQIKKGFPDAKSFWKILKDQKITFDELLASLEKELLKTKIIDHITTLDSTISTAEIYEHFKDNALGEPPLEYNLTLLVTGNKKYLVSLVNNSNINWDKALVNKNKSLFNEIVSIADLPENITELINVLPVGQFSPLLAYDKGNLFSIKINSMQLDMKAIPDEILLAITNKKKDTTYKAWLRKQLLKCTLTLNTKIFPPNDFNLSTIFLFNNNVINENPEPANTVNIQGAP